MPAVQLADGTSISMPDKPTGQDIAKLKQVQAIATTRASQGKRVSGTGTGEGRRVGRQNVKDYPELPFSDRTVVAAMDKPEESRAYLEKKYGEGSVSQDKRGLVVTVGGKKMRVSTGIAADITAQAPEMVLGTAGAIAGEASPLGPVGAVMGAFAGGMAGKGIKEDIKTATGLNRQTPGEQGKSVMMAGASMAAGEGAAKGVGLLRKIPGREMVFGTTPETKAMTDKMLKAGARPPPQSTMPDAKKLQRAVILAQKLTGPNKTIERANYGYLQDHADSILTKAGVGGTAKDETLRRLNQAVPDSAMSFQDTGKLIQNNSRYMLGPQTQVKGKSAAYLKSLAAKTKTPEQAYHELVTPGETDRLDRFVSVMGKNSTVVQAVQQRALREVLSGAMVRSEQGEAKGALEASLGQFTKKQQKLLFPGGLDKDLKTLGKEIQFLYPAIKDPAMAGFTAGGILQKVWYDRFYAQGTYAFMRMAIQNPAVMRRLAIGLDGTQPARVAAKKAIKEMFYLGALEMGSPNQDPADIPQAKLDKK
jgi:hypothetical protein